MRTNIEDCLQRLGVIRTFDGYNYTVKAIEIILEDEDNLNRVTKRVYTRVAEYFGCGYCCVERNIRTVRDNIWKYHKRELLDIAKYDIIGKPSASELLALIYNYVIRETGR